MISSTTGFLTFVPNTGFVGVVNFPYSISDGNGGSASANVNITITNNLPTAVTDNYSTPANTPVTLDPLSGDSDPDGQALIIGSINGITIVSGTTQTISVT
jgi:hypothetical protein